MTDEQDIIKQMESFDEYIRHGEPSQRERAANWRTAIGLQAVDGLKPSAYLISEAQKNIAGEITIDEVREHLRTYYERKVSRTDAEKGEEEADKVSANIAKLLNEPTFNFSPIGFARIHRRLFENVMKHAGEYRTYDITKKEWVLDGDTVLYGSCDMISQTLDYDFKQEKEFNYASVDTDETVRHICRFISGIWQIHPFCEGNTRTMAIFTIKYLQSFGFNVNNEVFHTHSWYFRNALVRANYNNLNKGITSDIRYLVRLFRNVLFNEQNELKNRYCHIRWKETEVEEEPKVQSANPKCKNCTLEETAALRIIETNPTVTQKELAAKIGKSERTVKTITVSLQEKGIIERINGKRNGYWRIIQ